MNKELSPIIHEGYIIKPITIESKTTKHGAQSGFAFVVCHNEHAVFGLGLKVFSFVEEDITEDVKKVLFQLGEEKVCSLIDKNEFEEGKYYRYEWTPNNPLIHLSEVNNNDEKWGMTMPSLMDYECAKNDTDE